MSYRPMAESGAGGEAGNRMAGLKAARGSFGTQEPDSDRPCINAEAGSPNNPDTYAGLQQWRSDQKCGVRDKFATTFG